MMALGVQERKDLAFTLKDTKTIVGKLRMILGLALHFIFIMFYLLIFAVSPHLATIPSFFFSVYCHHP